MTEITDRLTTGHGWGVAPRQGAGHAVVALSGELDATGAGRVGALVAASAVGVPWLIVDLAGLTFTDCVGMRALASAAQQARQAGGDLVLAAPGPVVRRMLELTGMMASVRVYSSVAAAAGITSPERAARAVPGSGARAIVAGLPLSGQDDAGGKKGSVGLHQQAAADDMRPRCP
jgi:anti-sigma B factor antagonist